MLGARSGAVEGVTSVEILDEQERALRSKLHFSDDKIADTIIDVLGFLRVVAITNTLKAVEADPNDDKVLECAVVAKAAYIVTGDRRHLLPMGSYQNIGIVSAADFLALMSSGR
jgi:putative PIN family toxin of toxin-antitoxin system